MKEAARPQDLSGVRTVVKDTTPGYGTNTPGENERGTSALPSPQWTNSTSGGPHNFNTPGPSGTGQDGKTLHKDKARTQGKPGGDHPGSKGGPASSAPGVHTRRPGVYGKGKKDQLYDEIMPTEEEILSVLQRIGAIRGKPYPGSDRQKEQRGQAKRYFQRWYRRNRGKVRTRMKRWHTRFKNRGRYKRDQMRREDNPERFKRRPGGARSVKQRSRDYRKELKTKTRNDKPTQKTKTGEALLKPVEFYHIPSQGWGSIVGVSPLTGAVTFQVGSMYQSRNLEEFFDEAVVNEDYFFEYLDKALAYDEADEVDEAIPDLVEDDEMMLRLAMQVRQRPRRRQRRQRGMAKMKAKRRYMRNRNKARMKARQRYKRMRNRPAFKRQRQIRRKHPERFRRRTAEVLTAPEIAFVIGKGYHLGYVRSISPMTGLVTYYRYDPEGNSAWLESLPVPTFLASVGFLSEQDADVMFELIDTELEDDPYEGLDMQGLLGSAALEGIDCSSDEFKALCEMLVGSGDLDNMSPSQLMQIDTAIVNRTVYKSEGPNRENAYEPDPADAYMIDPSDDDYIHGVVNLPEDYAHLAQSYVARQAEMLYQKVDRGDFGNKVDRGSDRKRLKDRRDRGERSLDDLSGVTNNPGSAKVIPEGHGLMNKDEKRFALRLGYRIADVMNNVDEDIRSKANDLTWKMRRVDKQNGMWLFDVNGKSGIHRVRVQGRGKGNLRRMSEADVFLSCSCPHWRWQGPEHWAKQNGYLYGKPRGTASYPVIRDPEHDHAVCQHVVAVLDHIIDRDWSIPKNPQRKKGSDKCPSRYLADILDNGEVWVVHTIPTAEIRALAARYLKLKGVPDAQGR